MVNRWRLLAFKMSQNPSSDDDALSLGLNSTRDPLWIPDSQEEAVSGSSQAKASFDLGGSPMVEEDVFESDPEMEKIMSQEGDRLDQELVPDQDMPSDDSFEQAVRDEGDVADTAATEIKTARSKESKKTGGENMEALVEGGRSVNRRGSLNDNFRRGTSNLTRF